MYNGMPSLVDGPAVTGGQPDLHGAFPGYQGGYRPQQQPAPNWFQTAAAQGTPWQNAGAGAGWRSTPAGPSWANTPTQGASGWPTANQFQQQAPGWAPQMPRQGWGPATPGPWGGGHSGPSTPWDWPEAPPQSAPASLSHGFSATAAPPPEVMQQSSSGQPITSNSWFAQAARGGGGGGGHGVHAGMHGGMAMHSGKQPRYNEDGEELDSAYDEEEEEDAWPGLRAGWGQQDPRPRWPQTPAQDPRTGWPPTPGHDPWAQTRDPLAGQWPRDEVALARTRTISGGHPKSPGKTKKRSNSFGGGMPAWGARAMYDETHLAKRPEDWREGYSPRGAMGADLSFSSLFRVGKKSDSGGASFLLSAPSDLI
ncbi:hypothetical protein DFH07DRAFT_31607 [Mycena maculata]|uniref:Uncharacterized protein n=1 Tax=Mycena maculata TaxID=230809 RepID=A0AAD7K2H0_9AGAR|nr:hypothetical protein DFH07DRAFT_31607 [Mycena maculata]